MNQQPQSIPPSPVEGSDELSLIGIWKVLVKYKLIVIAFTTLTTLGAIFYASTLPTVYKAEVLMTPAKKSAGGGGIGLSGGLGGLANMTGISLGIGSSTSEGEQELARLKTRTFLINHIKEKNLKLTLFADKWNKQEERWIDKEPSDREAYELLFDMITTNHDPRDKAGLVTLLIEWENPVNPNKIAAIANGLVSSLNFRAKQRAILEAKNSISFLEKELARTNIINSQAILYNLIEQQMGKIMMANVRDEFIFKVMDPAVIPERAEPKPILIIILMGLVAGISFGFFLSISVNYIREQLVKQ